MPRQHATSSLDMLLTSIFCGGTAITLEIFDPVKSLDAMEQHGVTIVGQIPAMFHLEWRIAGYQGRKLSSLQTAVYGGQAVARPVLERMLQMAPA